MLRRAIIVVLARCLALLAVALPAWAQPPLLVLTSAEPEVNLAARMQLSSLPAAQADHPDALWDQDNGPAPAVAPADLLVEPGRAVVGRVRLASGPSKAIYVVQVPSTRIDQVRLWLRSDGGAWRSAEAGDAVPLAHWPFSGPYPGFAIALDDEQVDLVISLRNDGRLRVPVWIKTEKAFQEGRLRQANLTGLVMGMGLMAAVVCLIAAVSVRVQAGWVLLAYALWVVLTVTCMNGYAAVWLMPDMPALNDNSKHLSVVVLSGLLLWASASLLDRLDQAWLRWLGPLATALALAWGLAQALWLPAPWRSLGVLVFFALCAATGLALCALSWLRGGRHVQWVAAALLATVLAAGLAVFVGPRSMGLDWQAAATACLLFAATLLLRHAQFCQLRYGRDVLGRAAVGANRDPLTALLSYTGLQQSHAQAVLREGAGQGQAALLEVFLPGLEASVEEHGFVLTERALLRLALCLQETLGQDWAIGRLSKTRFAAISLRPIADKALQDCATHVLSRCAREVQPLPLVADFDLRIVCLRRVPPALPFVDMLRELEEAGRAMEGGKRIAVL